MSLRSRLPAVLRPTNLPGVATIGRFRSLSRPRKKLLLATVAMTVLVRLSLTATSFRRTAEWLARLPTGEPGAVSRRDVRWAVTAASRYVPRTACLTRALTAHALCRRYGYDTEVHLGVDPSAAEFRAHSWVLSDGRVVVGDEVDLTQMEPLGEVEMA